jgi:hypothetical protein
VEQAVACLLQLNQTQTQAALRRVRAALLACRESALCDAAERGSRLSAASRLRDCRDEEDELDFFFRLWPLR